MFSNNYNGNGPPVGQYTATTTSSHTTYSAQAQPRSQNGHFDLSAPVIHFGTAREVQPRQVVNDAIFTKAQDDRMQSYLIPLTKEQKLLTMFVGRIPAQMDDYWMERILKSAGKLRQWRRASDGVEHPVDFGFAEYEEPEQLNKAYGILQNVQVPKSSTSDERQPFLIHIDEISKIFIEDYLAARDVAPNETKERASIATANGNIEKAFKDFRNPKFLKPSEQDQAKAYKQPKPKVDDKSAVTIMLSIEDELGDVAEDDRRLIAHEISSFRDRSARRDYDRARRLEEVEAMRLEEERKTRRLASVTRDIDATDAPDIALIRRPTGGHQRIADLAASESDLEQRFARELVAHLNTRYETALSKLQRSETGSKKTKNGTQLKQDGPPLQPTQRSGVYKMLADFDDDFEQEKLIHDYYKDHSTWLRNRVALRRSESERDEADRAEDIEASRMSKAVIEDQSQTQPDTNESLSKANTMNEAALQKIPLSAIRATQSARADSSSNTNEKVPTAVHSEKTVVANPSHDADRTMKLKALVAQIPTAKNELFAYEIQWDLLSDELLEKLRNFVARKLLEAIGMEEEDLMAFIIRKVKEHGQPNEIEHELTLAIGDRDEAELVTMKCWRYLIILMVTANIS